MISLPTLLINLPGRHRGTHQISARCPNHEDRRPSLSISQGTDGRILLYCHAGCSTEQIVAALRFAQGITWVKNHPVLGRKDFMNDCEHAWYGWREGAGHQFFGPNNATNVWPIKKVTPQSMVHLTEKPVELAARAILYSSQPGENVLDLFGGSGSTLIACEQTGRRGFLMELDPAYCDVIWQRWEQFTGRKAEHIRGKQS